MAVGRLKKDRVTESGNTAGRPSNPVIGDTYYDGTLGFLMIFDGTNFILCSAPASQPTIAITDVGTSVAYGTVQASVAFTEGVSGGKAAGFTAIQGSTTSTSTSTPIVLTVTGNPGSYLFNGTAFNGFGTSPQSLSVSQTLTSVPQAPTIGTATASGSANEIAVTWTLGSNGGKNLSAITIIPYLNGTTAETARTAATTSSTSYTFTEGQLTAGASYTFKVKTTNANGTGLESVATNSATMPNFLIANTLVIAGGGAGGSIMGGGGGAGGLVYSTVNFAPGTAYTVTVGAGAAQTAADTTAASGSNSNITGGSLSLTAAVGGGGGGRWISGSPFAGGSGGGSGPQGGSGGAGTSGQGFAGGSGSYGGTSFRAGGGGGSAEAGGTDEQRDGGDGLDTYSSWGAATSSGENSGGIYYYAGGGGGAFYDDTNGTPPAASIGGLGGGGYGGRANGNNSLVVAGAPGTANTGGGGGGNGVYSGSGGDRTGKAGGSGIAIIRLTGSVTAASTTGSPARYETGGYTYYKFTGIGSITF
jgi:hypothetical protein